MTGRPDHGSHTEHDAGLYDQEHAYPDEPAYSHLDEED